MPATIDNAYAFHFAVFAPSIDVFADLKFCALNVAPFATSPDVKLGPRLRSLRLRGCMSIVDSGLIKFRLRERSANAEIMLGLQNFHGPLRQRLIERGFGDLSLGHNCFEPRRLPPRLRRRVVGVNIALAGVERLHLADKSFQTFGQIVFGCKRQRAAGAVVNACDNAVGGKRNRRQGLLVCWQRMAWSSTVRARAQRSSKILTDDREQA